MILTGIKVGSETPVMSLLALVDYVGTFYRVNYLAI